MKPRLESTAKFSDFTAKGRDKIEKICRKAATLFSEKGYRDATLADVSRAAGITKAGIYHYFTTKEELLFFILHYYMEGVLEKARRNFSAEVRPEEKIRRFILDHIRYLDENFHESRLIINQWRNLAPGYRDIIRKHQKAYVDLLGTEVDNLLAGSGTRGGDRRLITYILMGMCNSPYNWYRQGGSFSPDKIAREIHRIFMGGLSSKQIRRGGR